jgi:hypothetical protein
MKNNILIIVTVSLFLLSFDKATSLLSNRSKEQVVVHGTNVTLVANQINAFYTKGYRVTNIVSQPVSTATSSDINPTYLDLYGEVIVIMEK